MTKKEKMMKKKMKMQLQYFARQDNYPEPNLQDRANFQNLEEVEIDFAYRFSENFNSFIQALGITRQMPINQGEVIKFYTNPEVTLQDGRVGEGELIPLSHVEPQVHSTREIELDKYRKATSGEAIQRYGRTEAVNITDAALVREVQKGIRDDLFEVITAGQSVENMNNGTLQGALATAWGNLQTIFEDDAIVTVAFAHPLDIAREIANKELTLENQFGLNYYTTVTGTVVFATSQVPQGSIYATASENLVVAYINPNNSDLAQTFNFTSDEFGYIGMTHFLQHETLTQQSLFVSGVLIFPERIDGVIQVEIEAAGETGEAAGSGDPEA